MAMGLTSAQARKRLAELGENRIGSQPRAGAFTFFIAQFKSPIILILIGAAVVSLFLQDRTDAALILAMWRKHESTVLSSDRSGVIIAQRLTCVHLNGPRLTLVTRQIIRIIRDQG